MANLDMGTDGLWYAGCSLAGARDKRVTCLGFLKYV